MQARNLMVCMIVFLFFAATQTVLGYDENFHPVITKKAIDKSKLSITDYLKTELGFEAGLDEKFKGPTRTLPYPLTVREWIERGSK